ncbi:putative GEM-like protein 8 [Vitis vinifera]|uniref:GRAM domain-containing protein n=1 Tax=Vitis vinifera TaxID=29760 RepID=F6HW15_VITVI|nr:putative GEM-like protein 8 [Vitis vinifera]
MKNQLAGQIIGIPVSRQNENPSSSNTSLALTHSKILSLSSILSHSFLLCISATVLENFNGSPFANGVVLKNAGKVDRKKKMNRHEKKDYNFVQGIREHVRLGPKISETVKGKLSLGARILQLGGVKRVFKQIFGVREGEKLLKASQCYLSTTAGPLAGLLFISTQRVAFCSERSIKFSSPNGELVRFHYKVSIPLRKVKRVDPSENVKNPSQKYMEIVTVDNFDFWFMGFLNYQKSFNCLQQALSQS